MPVCLWPSAFWRKQSKSIKSQWFPWRWHLLDGGRRYDILRRQCFFHRWSHRLSGFDSTGAKENTKQRPKNGGRLHQIRSSLKQMDEIQPKTVPYFSRDFSRGFWQGTRISYRRTSMPQACAATFTACTMACAVRSLLLDWAIEAGKSRMSKSRNI